MITPGYAPPRELHMFPYSAEVTRQVGDAISLLAASELFTDAQRAHPARPLRHPDPVAAAAIAEGDGRADGAGDPHGFWARAASHLGVPEAIEVALARVGGDRGASSPASARCSTRSPSRGWSPEAPLEAREQLVHAFADSGPEALAGIHTLRGLALSLFYALPDLGTGRNPSWDAIGYPGPRRQPPAEPKPLAVRRPEAGAEAMTIEADVCVVGSGAGGGVIAGTLAEAGKQVCVLELGGYFNEADFNQLEVWGFQNLYLRGGPIPTAEGQVSMQAGSSLGGGTVINWQNCLRTFPWVREQWAREHGLEGLDGPEFDRCLDQVMERIGVTDSCSELNGPHQRLREGCEALGWDFKLITRNVDPAKHEPDLAGYVGFGDVTGSKLSTQKTYLADAHERGADLVVNCRAERILVEDGRAAGVEGTYAGPDGAAARVVVRAPQVVVACGSIESPALLRRSGIGGPAVGDYLRLHPVGGLFGAYDEAAGRLVGSAAVRALPRVRRAGPTATASCSRAPTTRSGSRPPRRPGSPAASTSRSSPGCATTRC